MKVKLLPCPECGGTVKIHGGPEEWIPSFYDPDSGGDPYHVECCGTSLWNTDNEDIVLNWNAWVRSK